MADTLGASTKLIHTCCACSFQTTKFAELANHYSSHSLGADIDDHVKMLLKKQNLAKEDTRQVESDFVMEANVEAPINTKLYFTNVKDWKQWTKLYNFYLKRFGPKHINQNGTFYVPEKCVGYINFYHRSDMLGAIKYQYWKPREAIQEHPAQSIPRFAAFAVGFENWQIDVIKPVALQLFKARELIFKEQREQPGIAVGWAIVIFNTKDDLKKALEKRKFSLKCKNRTIVIALQPYRYSIDQTNTNDLVIPGNSKKHKQVNSTNFLKAPCQVESNPTLVCNVHQPVAMGSGVN